MKRSAGILVIIVTVAAIAVTVAPASAIVLYKPDAMINPATVGWIGDDVYGADGSLQEGYLGLPVGATGDFEIAVENDGAFADRFFFDGCASKRGYKVRYFRDGNNVTDKVVKGTFHTPSEGSGVTYFGLHLRIKPTADAQPDLRCNVKVSSDNEPGTVDVVRAKVELLSL